MNTSKAKFDAASTAKSTLSVSLLAGLIISSSASAGAQCPFSTQPVQPVFHSEPVELPSCTASMPPSLPCMITPALPAACTPVAATQSMHMMPAVQPMVINSIQPQVIVPNVAAAGTRTVNTPSIVNVPASTVPALRNVNTPIAARVWSNNPLNQATVKDLAGVNLMQPARMAYFSTANQILSGGRGTTFAGRPGTLVTQKQGLVILHSGKLLAQSGEEPAIIRTAAGTIHLSARTRALVEAMPQSPIRLTVLDGGGDGGDRDATFTPDGGGQAVACKSGEALILTDKSVEPAELIPVDGFSPAINGGIERIVSSVSKELSSSKPTVVGRLDRRAGRSVRVSNSMQTNEEQHMNQAGNWAPMSGASAQEPIQIISSSGSEIKASQSGQVEVVRGLSMLNAPANTVVKTPLATVIIKRQCLIMIDTTNGATRVKSFGCPGAVSVSTTGSHVVALNPGDEASVFDHVPANWETSPADNIARRPGVSTDLGNHNILAICDFSIVSFMKQPAYLSGIKALDPSEKLYRATMKTAVVVELVKQGHGAYTVGNAADTLLSSDIR